jgi:hypothetical protein
LTRRLKPCGTVGGYSRHRLHNEEACEACRIAWRNYHRARRAAGYTQPDAPHELAPCGTYAAHQRHLAHGEPVCEACAAANRAYKTEYARARRTAKRERREALDQMLAEVLAEVNP